MMKFLKKAAAALLALAIVAAALLCTGCSTPKVAVTVDNQKFTTGEYLAYLYNSFNQIYINQSLYYYDLYIESYDVWGETYTYNDEKMDLRAYIKASAKDTIVRQVALEKMLDEHKLAIPDEDKAAADEYLATLPNDAFIEFGFNNKSFEKMYRAYNGNERALFYGLYGEGGERAVPAEDIRGYFDKYYLSYEIISHPLTDDDGDLSEEEIADVQKALEGYLALYNETGDFNAVIDKQKADTAAAKAAEAEEADDTADKEEDKPSTLADNRVDITDDESGDKELVAALNEMEFNEVKIIDYKTDAGVATKALVLRLDPEADRGEDEDGNAVDYFAEQKEAILYHLKFDEFNEEVKKVVDGLKVTVNTAAVKACDPYEFRKIVTG